MTVLATKFTELVGCEVPIQLAPMAASARCRRRADLPAEAPVAKVALGPMTIDVPRFGFVPPIASAEGDLGAMALYAGESAALVDALVPAGEIVTRIAHEAGARLRAVAP